MTPGKKILLVDDQPQIRKVLSALLRREGYQVIEADGGAAAVALTASERPDVILMDLEMPFMDGWEAAQLIKSAPETADVRIIAISGHDVFRGDASLFASTIAKPIPPELLLAELERHTGDPGAMLP